MPATSLILDHVFVFVEPGAPEAATLDEAGLRESFRRDHPGQGTTNVCYCFDNAYLELLWETDRAEITSPAIAPTRLAERAQWRDNGACPFGIAVRTPSADAPLPFQTWTWDPPFLPDGMVLPVATLSEDANQPFVFRSPGHTRPDAWTDGRAGRRQTEAGLAEIVGLHLDRPPRVPPNNDLRTLAALGLLTLGTHTAWRMVLTLSRRDGGPPRRLCLPAFTWAD